MKKMKIFKFTPIFVLLLLLGSSCRPTTIVAVQPACIDMVPSEVKLDAQFLGFCTQFFEQGNSKNMKVEIAVDGLAFDANAKTVTLSFMETFDFPKASETSTNDSNSPQSPVNKVYPIKLPRCGSYAITVIVRGADGTCFKCCKNSTFTGSKSCSGTGTGNGTARFRVVTAQINSSLSTPPAIVNVTPLPEKCSACGC